LLAPSNDRLLDLVFPRPPEPAGREVPRGPANAGGDDRLTVRFWGTRGGAARAGSSTARFGGNTLCVTVELDHDRLFVFDAGTGMINFGQFVERRKRQRYNVFLSNSYWDHVQGLPFFAPLHSQENQVVVHGTGSGEFDLKQLVAAQRSNPYLPVVGRERSSRIEFRELEEGDYEINQVQVSVIGLNHPGPALGYRLTSASGKTVAYVTGNEVFPHCASGAAAARERLVSFLKGVDVLIHDATYFDDEYRQRVGTGHSPVSAVLTLAAEARVKRLYLFHHDPSHDDEAIGRMESIARYFFEQRRLPIACWAAREGAMVTI
jgi:phosphoribosyl 1,2-cyclic phosphodiesterase